MKTFVQLLFLLASLAASVGPAIAADGDGGAAGAAGAADKFSLPVNIVPGDRIKLRSNMYELTPGHGAQGRNAPVDTCLRVIRVGDDGGIAVVVEDGGRACRAVGSNSGEVQPGDVYQISGGQLKDASYSRYGWIYGPMFVPFKYFPHDKSFEPSQSLGMYMGYRTSWFESRGLSFVASAGLATMKVSQIVDDPNSASGKVIKENTVAGYTFATGVLFDLTREVKPFVAGLLVGRDFVGNNSALPYVHEGHSWVAIQVGWVQ